jgi:ribonuclease PH
MLDLCYDEDSRAEVDMNVAMTGAGLYVEVQSTAEQTPFNDARLTELLGLARVGVQDLIAIQKQTVKLA